jgi:hypothetical protein
LPAALEAVVLAVVTKLLWNKSAQCTINNKQLIQAMQYEWDQDQAIIAKLKAIKYEL